MSMTLDNTMTSTSGTTLLTSTTPVVRPPYVFHDPLPLRSSAFPEQAVSPDMQVTLISSPKPSVTFQKLLKDPSVPLLVISGTLWRRIRYMVESRPNSEMAMFLMVREIDDSRPHFLAYDMFMPGQEAGGAGVSLDGAECEKHFANIADNTDLNDDGQMHRRIAHLHSHANMNVFWSSTDDHQQLSREDLGFMSDSRIYVVTNVQGDVKAAFVSYRPVLFRADMAVAVSYAIDEHTKWLLKSDRDDLDELMRDSIRTPSMATSARPSEFQASTPATATPPPVQKSGFRAPSPQSADLGFADWVTGGYMSSRGPTAVSHEERGALLEGLPSSGKVAMDDGGFDAAGNAAEVLWTCVSGECAGSMCDITRDAFRSFLHGVAVYGHDFVDTDEKRARLRYVASALSANALTGRFIRNGEFMEDFGSLIGECLSLMTHPESPDEISVSTDTARSFDMCGRAFDRTGTVPSDIRSRFCRALFEDLVEFEETFASAMEEALLAAEGR